VFASIKPKTGYYLSETEKQRIIDDIITPKSILSVKTEIIDPSYTYLKLQIDVRYDKNKTNLAVDTIKNSIRLVVLNYKLTNLDKFDGQFNTSSLVESILAIDKSIVACDINVRLSKKVEPTLNVNRSYTIDFKNKLLRGSIDSQLQSDEFYVLDAGNTQRLGNLEEVPNSYTGIEKITITNPGYGYTEIPTVTITGDGTGATALPRVNTQSNTISSIIISSKGSGYTHANVIISDSGTGANATARAVLSPPGGHGSNPLFELGGSYLVLNPRLKGSENGKFPTVNEFRQVSLLLNPKERATNNAAANVIYSQLVIAVLDTGITNYNQDELVYQGPSLSSATFTGIIVIRSNIEISSERGIRQIRVITTCCLILTQYDIYHFLLYLFKMPLLS